METITSILADPRSAAYLRDLQEAAKGKMVADKITALTPEELDRIFDYCVPKIKVAAQLLVEAGLTLEALYAEYAIPFEREAMESLHWKYYLSFKFDGANYIGVDVNWSKPVNQSWMFSISLVGPAVLVNGQCKRPMGDNILIFHNGTWNIYSVTRTELA